MKYRFLELSALETIAADGTKTIDLDMADPISEIVLDTRVTNTGGGADTTEHPMATVTNVEIIDGSDVLFSLDGLEMHALDIYHSGIHPRGGWYRYQAGDYDQQTAISFGRHLWDPLLAFDPKKFRNPQLRITFDIDAGGMAPSQCKLSVLAALFDEKVISPIGFLMSKEIKRWTTDASAHEYTDLPTDYPYRKLLLQARYADYPPHWVLNNIKLSEDQDKKIVVNNEFRDLMFGIGRENAYVHEKWTVIGTAGGRIYHVTPTMDVMGTAATWAGSILGGDMGVYNGDGGKLQVWTGGEANIQIIVDGWAPHGTLQIPFGLQNEIEDWYDVSKIGSLKLDITDGVDSATSKIFLQQLRRY